MNPKFELYFYMEICIPIICFIYLLMVTHIICRYHYKKLFNLCVTILSRIKLNSPQISIRNDLHFHGGMSVID
jgi:hypothetical protein